tara:strand:+ start:142 stop:372 length:231 start_codon:yes stop_codon:yes gene_type:complete
MNIFNLILAGFFLLFFAIIMNAVIKFFSIMNWYDLLMNLQKKERPKMKVIDFLWLFLGYPFFLGLIIYFTAHVFYI